MRQIFEYINYRKFLKDFYLFKKEKNNEFSFRIFSAQAGFTSPNFLKLVMDNKKNLGKDSLPKICKAVELKKRESEYFSYLVFFSQAKTTIDRNYYFGLIASFRTPSKVKKINLDQFDYYSNWYIPVVREVINNKTTKITYKEIAELITPIILPKEAKKAIEVLEKLKLIVRKNNIFIQSSPLLSTDNDVKSLALRNFQKKMIELSLNAQEELPLDKRSMSSLTVKISEQGRKKITKRINEFREELMQIVLEDKDVDQVQQINFQFFPVSEKGC